MTRNNPNLDFINIYAHIKWLQILSISFQDIEQKRNSERNSDISQGNNSIINVWKIMCNNPNLDLVSIDAYRKFGKILSICFKDIEWKLNYD